MFFVHKLLNFTIKSSINKSFKRFHQKVVGGRGIGILEFSKKNAGQVPSSSKTQDIRFDEGVSGFVCVIISYYSHFMCCYSTHTEEIRRVTDLLLVWTNAVNAFPV